MSDPSDETANRELAKARAEAYRTSEQFHRDEMAATNLPRLREKHRIAADRFAQLARVDEQFAASKPQRL
ncbi:hypothetical protein ACO2Q0_20925 [Phenylobacterium sp. VNQ135]|uniref:hypothetical protein n=1 Tax=Phenylobacterium sp. VNQ135 TaxID=3400922 RepID=UPI003C083F41